MSRSDGQEMLVRPLLECTYVATSSEGSRIPLNAPRASFPCMNGGVGASGASAECAEAHMQAALH